MINQKVVTTKKLKFSKTSRLVVRSEFQKVFNLGKRLNSYSICLYYYANENQGSRLGVVIAKRVVPKAVNRNAFKRLVKESFRLVQENILGYDLIILVKKTPDSKVPTPERIKCDLQKLWQRIPQSLKGA